MKYLIGETVVAGGEVGHVIEETPHGILVHRKVKGHASTFAHENVRPLQQALKERKQQ